jgi:XTP/dITP diphosphohydrolase
MAELIKLIFATHNPNKVAEIQSAIGNHVSVISLDQAGILMDIPEPHSTLEANASEKSRRVHELTGWSCFGEDTGLEVDRLQGEPGVKSARYAGEDRNFDRNIDKLLARLGPFQDRRARFRTVISLIWEETEWLFEGICQGRIAAERLGSNGFGYDPVFIPEGSILSFAQMNMQEKNRFSHRKKAADKLVTFLKSTHLIN